MRTKRRTKGHSTFITASRRMEIQGFQYHHNVLSTTAYSPVVFSELPHPNCVSRRRIKFRILLPGRTLGPLEVAQGGTSHASGAWSRHTEKENPHPFPSSCCNSVISEHRLAPETRKAEPRRGGRLGRRCGSRQSILRGRFRSRRKFFACASGHLASGCEHPQAPFRQV